MTKDQSFAKAILAAIGVYTIWGFSFLASDVCQRWVTPFTLLAYRFDIAVLLLTVPIILGRKKLRLRGKNIKPLLLLGTMEPCLYFIGEQYGLRYTNSAFSGVMIAIIPIVTMLMSVVFLKDRPAKAQWIFSALSIAGIVVITLSENSGGNLSVIGVLWLVLAVLTGSAYGVLSRSLKDEFNVFERTYVMQVMGAVLYTVLVLIEQKGQLGGVIAPLADGKFLLSVLYLAVGASVIGYTLFNYALSNAPVTNTVIFCNLTTVLSVAAGIVVLGDPFSAVSVIAMIVVLVGIWGVQKYTPQDGK